MDQTLSGPTRRRVTTSGERSAAMRRRIRMEAAGQEVLIQRQARKHCAVRNSESFFSPVPFTVGEMSFVCEFCGAQRYKDELRTICCKSGKIISVANAVQYPDELKNLLMGNTVESRNFRLYIRQFNNSNAFASMGAEVHELEGRGAYCFKVSGDIYHLSSSNVEIDTNLDSPNISQLNNRKFAELYIYDTDTSVNIRMNHPANADCTRENMELIAEVLFDVSPYAASYRTLREKYEEEENISLAENVARKEVRLIFTRNVNDDQRVYNAPNNTNDVALVFTTDRDGNMAESNIDFCVYPGNSRNAKRISALSRHIDPMVFPVFFPHGESGWTTNIPHNMNNATAVRNKVTACQFYSYRIAVRQNIFNPLHYGGKLFQQYLVFAYARVESNNLQYIRKNQKNLRVESYQGLMDQLNVVAQQNNAKIGNLFILPSTFQNGPRFMEQLYQDNMAMVRKFGRPDLFITFTCNPKWKDITVQLEEFQTAIDRPDIVVRVFNIKLNQFIHDINNGKIFGDVLSYVYVIEYQKRGLPHAHCLFTLGPSDKLINSETIDNIVCAEIPSPTANPSLYAVIMQHNIHTPCGQEHNRSAVCLKPETGTCSKDFPKSFRDETFYSLDGYPRYKRADNSADDHRTNNNVRVHNGWVVPYNPYLSLKYEAHINVEICSSVKAIKYIHKYITKGHDCARIGIDVNGERPVVNYDEIKQFLNCRYLSAHESAFRLFGFHSHKESHNVFRLAVHLELGQPVYFQEDEEEEALRRASVKLTTLTAFFKLNDSDPNINILYQDLPNEYKLDSSGNWIKRSDSSHFGNKCIGRITSISPRNIELYHLRLLLINICGKDATSFKQLRCVNGIEYATYREAARVRGLINDSNEWRHCLAEASSSMLPNSLRILFVTILCYCEPGNPMSLYEEFKESFIEDFIHQGYSEAQSNYLCLNYLHDECRKNGFDLTYFIPRPTVIVDLTLATNYLPNHNNLPLLWPQLNSAQRIAGDMIMDSLRNSGQNNCFYIDGPGGSGKTFLYNALIQQLQTQNLNILCVAWTGIAAALLPNGVTCHSAFHLPLNLDRVSFPKLTASKRTMLASLDVVIWDEAPMAHGLALDIIDLIFRDIS